MKKINNWIVVLLIFTFGSTKILCQFDYRYGIGFFLNETEKENRKYISNSILPIGNNKAIQSTYENDLEYTYTRSNRIGGNIGIGYTIPLNNKIDFRGGLEVDYTRYNHDVSFNVLNFNLLSSDTIPFITNNLNNSFPGCDTTIFRFDAIRIKPSTQMISLGISAQFLYKLNEKISFGVAADMRSPFYIRHKRDGNIRKEEIINGIKACVFESSVVIDKSGDGYNSMKFGLSGVAVFKIHKLLTLQLAYRHAMNNEFDKINLDSGFGSFSFDQEKFYNHEISFKVVTPISLKKGSNE